MILFLIKIIKNMSEYIPCPRCGGLSWITTIDEQPVQRCVCGLMLFLEVMDNGMLTTHIPKNIDKVTLPSKGSQLSKILGCLVVLGNMSSLDVAKRLKVSTNNVTTNLCVLRSRGLVRIVTNRRGYIGGSLWGVDENVKKKFLGGQ